MSHSCVLIDGFSLISYVSSLRHTAHFWFSALLGSPSNISGLSVSMARAFFFSLNLPEWDTLTWRPSLAVVLSTILSRRASSWGSCASASGWAAAAGGGTAEEPLLRNSEGSSYRTLAWDFFLLRKVNFHQLGEGSAMMDGGREGWGQRKREITIWNVC